MSLYRVVVLVSGKSNKKGIQMGKQWNPRSHDTDIKIRDTVKIYAISTTDGWHEHRHALLFQEAVVEYIKQATPHRGYDYKNWFSATVRLVEHTATQQKRLIPSRVMFTRVQFKKVKDYSSKDGLIDMNYKINIHNEKRLRGINEILSNGVIIPENELDIKGWKKLWKSGYPIQASFVSKNIYNDIDPFDKGGKGHSFTHGEGKVKFRLKEIA
jgi:hypothetical protein